MILNKRVKAFTLSEMLVVLVVSSIVIAITFMVLNLVQKQVSTIRTNFSKQQEIQTLERILWQDFNSYNAYYNQVNDILEFTNNKEIITYNFNTDYILRNSDTIHTSIASKSLFLNGNLINNGYVDAITIITEKLYTSNKIFAYKQKDAAYYLNN